MEIMNIDRKCRARSRCSFYDVRPRRRSNSFSTLDHLTKLPSVMDWARNSFSLEIQKSYNIFSTQEKKKAASRGGVGGRRGSFISALKWCHGVLCRNESCVFDQVLDPPLEKRTRFIIQHWNCNAYKPARASSQETKHAGTIRAEFTGNMLFIYFFFSLVFLKNETQMLLSSPSYFTLHILQKKITRYYILAFYVSCSFVCRWWFWSLLFSDTVACFGSVTWRRHNRIWHVHVFTSAPGETIRRVKCQCFPVACLLKGQGYIKPANISILF